MKATMNVMGMDPGFSSFGWAVVGMEPGVATRRFNGGLHDIPGLLTKTCGVIRTKKSAKKLNTKATSDNVERSRFIARELGALLDRWRPVAVCAESFSPPRSSSVAAKVALAWGVLVCLCEARDIPIVLLSPQEVKKDLAGKRDASKEEVAQALRGLCLLDDAVHLAGIPKGEHEHPIDAIACVVAGRDSEPLRMARQMGRAA